MELTKTRVVGVATVLVVIGFAFSRVRTGVMGVGEDDLPAKATE